MIDAKNAVELNGVKYRLAEDAEGQHYVLGGEPLRPPNAVTVQGENQKFQVRADTLLWHITDWSGGEGQRIFDPQAPNRSYELNGVRVFERPGTLRPGMYIEDTLDNVGATFTDRVLLVVAATGLYALSTTTNAFYAWNSGTGRWGASQSFTGPSNGASAVTSDSDFIYWVESGSTTVWRVVPGGTAASSISTTLITSGARKIVAQGNNVYVGNVDSGDENIWEIAKIGSTPLNIVDHSIRAATQQFVALDGFVYSMATDEKQTEILKITPTSAAGTGFGKQFALLNGFYATGFWQQDGVLYLVGEQPGSTRSVILYLSQDGTYGTLGHVTVDDEIGDARAGYTPSGQNVRLLDHFFASQQRSAADTAYALWQIDSISGGFANVGYAEDTGIDDTLISSLVAFDTDIFFAGLNGATTGALRAREDQYTKDSNAVSPWHDFGLADEKILGTLVLSMEALPADWTVHVDYATNGSTTFVNAISETTDNTTTTTTTVSTDLSTVTFHTLQIRIRFEYTGGGVPTTAPIVHAVEVRSSVVQPQKVWNLLLDCSDDHSRRGGESHSGAAKIANVKTVGDAGTVVDFKDGYGTRQTGSFDQYDVFVDGYKIILTRPGEGVAVVSIREVI